ncbi:MAG TPA: UMP kinase, partial [Nitrospinaceae bacterium]|nr:UMP kinase [Nitrospinaceae bacterium]
MSKSVYKRVLLKLSGESLAEQDGGFGIDVKAIKNLAKEVLDGKNLGVEMAIVIGGGN